MPTLDWIGKSAVVNHHREVPTQLLHCDSALSVGNAEDGNLLVEGDNLRALKALLPYYAGSVRCVYIDPPFNTGNDDWIYNDNLTAPEIVKWIGETVGPEAVDLCRHDKWLCMMFPRLKLLRDFLSDDGTFFIHIDDNELSSTLCVCDEIFGRVNRQYLVTFKQSSVSGPKSVNAGIVTTANYIAIYSKKWQFWKPSRVVKPVDRDSRYSKYIENVDADCQDWRITNIRLAFARAHGLKVADLRSSFSDNLEEEMSQFVIDNAASVIRTARILDKDVSASAREALEESRRTRDVVVKALREGRGDYYFLNGEQVLFYSSKVRMVDGVATAGEPISNIWDDILSNNLHNEGGVEFPKGKKPEALVKRCLELATKPGDIVLDSFAGSGTTAAVAHKMGRRWLTVEMGEHAKSHVGTRLEAVVAGTDTSGITAAADWQGGGGFRYCRLGRALFDEWGVVSEGVTFSDLAAFIFFSDTGVPIPTKASGETSLLGTFQGRAIYLLFAPRSLGVADERAGNVLSLAELEALPAHDGPRVVYAEGCTVPAERLSRAGVVFKQVPYQLQAA